MVRRVALLLLNFGKKTMSRSNIEIRHEDISISTYNIGSKWFPNHNGVIVTHIPTGIWAHCGEERNQHRNKHNAFEMLMKKLQTAKGIEKPHIFIHKGWWRVSRHVKPNPLWLWHKANWQINQWNDERHRANSSNTK